MTCAHVVVDVARDAAAFLLHGVLLFDEPHLVLKSPGRDEVRSQDDHQQKQGGQTSPEPGRLPEELLNYKRQFRSGFVPDAVVVAADHPETVCARRNLVVGGYALRARIYPARVYSFDLVFESHLLRHLEAERGVMDFQFSAARRNGQPARGWKRSRGTLACLSAGLLRDGLLVREQLFDVHGRRQPIEIKIGIGIHHGQAFGGGKPKSPVAAFPGRGLADTAAPHGGKPVLFAINHAGQGVDFLRVKPIKVVFADTKDTLRTAQPKPALLIFQDFKNLIAEQPLPGAVARQAREGRSVAPPAAPFRVGQPIKPAALSPDPESLLTVFVQRRHRIVQQTVGGGEAGELPGLIPRQAAVGPNPEAAIPIFGEGADIVARQAVGVYETIKALSVLLR